MTTEQLDLIYTKLLQIHQLMNTNLAEQARSFGHSTSEYVILLDVMTHPNSDLNALCDRLGMKRSAASKTVQKLVEKDIIIRTADGIDRRKINLNINPSYEPDFCQNVALNQTFNGSDQVEYDFDEIISSLNIVTCMLSE
ncbi:MarR family transcriptional regulator [Erysipelothrix sp. HDW6A]|uniref:MarR family winged helix-turn-helix transcriptional regulator n=1 Tax=Erysipelothrix sp. HDW6A TaxID=2714928 RepID=UPI001407B442|nr:helix-turn-helix domain-containing protein [Erysipelothrix sp. HDW6A]QIK57095.1 MarR family transcriptional regulator [Erysipelothrix sp. HDW6A]